MDNESVRTSWPSSRPTFEDASVGPEVYSFARIKARAPSGLKAPARRLAQAADCEEEEEEKAMMEARRNERAKCAAKVKEKWHKATSSAHSRC
jgi:hypothetical protein